MKKKKIMVMASSILLGVALASCTGIKVSDTTTTVASTTTVLPTTTVPSTTVAPTTTVAPSTTVAPTTSLPIERYYTVSFITDGGSNLDNVSILEGNCLNRPNEPTKEGYTFGGWYKDSNLTIEYDFNTPITGDISLYAKWNLVDNEKITVVFMDGDTNIGSQELDKNSTVTEIAAPIHNGYEFLGWYESLDDLNPFDFTTQINTSIVLYAKYNEIVNSEELLFDSYNEGIQAAWPEGKVSSAKAYYKLSGSTEYVKVDSNLIRVDSSKPNVGLVDIVGLKAGTYDIKIISGDGVEYTASGIEVEGYDRSGYAHFKYSEGIGAYNNDGTLKSNAIVVYVTESTKNTVSATINGKVYTGLVAILNAQSSSSNPIPINIRIIGKVNADTWNQIDYKEMYNLKVGSKLTPDQIVDKNGKSIPKANYTESEIISNGYNTLQGKYEQIKGITNRIKYDSSKLEFDSYYNMVDVTAAKYITVEGIGSDAMAFQWGFTWKNSSSIEVRNITFDDYTEDACSFEGSDDSTTISGFKTGNIWIHNNTFNEGINYWDVCSEQDKHEGDGATDFKKNAFITVSYNHYYKNHKTGLVGGSDSQHTACLTYHHNFYDQCSSRLPLGRQANMHMYNNYYYKSSGTNMSLRGGAFALVEGCYVESCNNPFEVKSNAAVKLYNSIVENCKETNQSTVVTSREERVENGNVYDPNFDTNPEIFYYDSVNKKSNVSYLTTAQKAKEDCVAYSGVHKITLSSETVVSTKYTVSFEVNGGNAIDSIEVKEGSTIVCPTPIKVGYDFVGWYLDSDLTNAFISTTEITSNIVLYAKWKEAVEEVWTTIVNENFGNTTTIGTQPVTDAFYYNCGSSDVNSTTNNLNIANGVLNIYDQSTVTTYGYYKLGNTITSGKVKVSVDMTCPLSGKWSMLHFLGDGKDLSVRTNPDKKLTYYYYDSNNQEVYGSTLVNYKANEKFTVELLLDLDAGIASITINGTSITVEGFMLECFDGIMLQTAGSASRNFSIDNFVIQIA